MDSATFGTGPLPNIQRERVKEMPAGMTAFGTGIELVNRHDSAAIPGRFVLQLPDEFSPAHVGYRFCQAMMLHHVLHRQRLDTDHLVVADESRRQLVQKITASIGYAGMDTSHLTPRLLSILGTFVLARMGTLGTRQALFIFGKVAFVASLFPRRERHHVMQAQINPNGLA